MTPVVVFTFFWMSASLAAFGVALFPYYARTKPARLSTFLRQVSAVVVAAAAAAIAQHIAIIGATVAQIAGTGLGHIWATQLVIAVLLVVSAWRGSNLLTALLAGAELIGFAFVGHANAISGDTGTALQALHLLAAGGWLGGVIALAYALREPNVGAPVNRFSWAGLAFVAVIGVTGVAILFANTGALLPITQMRYGQLALTKIVLFAAALACAAFNRFIATPRANWATMARVIGGELALLIVIIAAAVLLAQNEPYG